MRTTQSLSLPLAFSILASLGSLGPGVAAAQQPALNQAPPVASRIAGDWRTSAPVQIPLSRPTQLSLDPSVVITETAAPANARLQRMLLLLAPSAAQQQALDAELAAQLDRTSPEYHRWLTPAAFADAFANSASDAGAVAAWLASQGFDVSPLPAGRGWIEFSGTVAQVELALHTRVSQFSAAGEPRFVLTRDISVPAALAPLIAGFASLDGTVVTPLFTTPLTVAQNPLALENAPDPASPLTPQRAAAILHFDSLHSSGITGAGQAIAIPSRSQISAEDAAGFRAAFGLPDSAVSVVSSGAEAGFTLDQAEATLTAAWAAAAAPGAQIILVPAATTGATDGLDLALAAIVDQDLAPIVALGDSVCEGALAPAHRGFYAAVYRQAAAEGISIVAAAGDSGAAACHQAGTAEPVRTGYAVNALASTPWNTAVGVAAFTAGEPLTEPAAYSAWSPAEALGENYAGGGGGSLVYPAPAWQPIPARLSDGDDFVGAHNRLLPDLSLPTAAGSSNGGVAFCLHSSGRACALVRAGGSSAAAALFAGIAALVNQKNGRQGNLAPHLYAMNRQSGIFADIERGTSKLPCVSGSNECASDGQIGFSAEIGYDLATGLGVVNAEALVRGWAQPQVTGTAPVTITNTIAASQTINPSGSIVLSASVVSGNGGAAPTGTVTFVDITLGQNVATVSLNAGSGESSTASVTVIGVLAQGGHQLVADYSGDSTYAAATSQPVVVEVEPSSTTTTVLPSTSTPAGGAAFTVSATIASVNAGAGALPPSGTVDFRLDGVSQGLKTVVTGTPSTASINMTAPLTAGSHQLVGFYSGDTNYFNSTSAAATITVSKSATVTTVTANPPALAPATTETLTATIAPSPAVSGSAFTISGTVSFYDNGTALLGTAQVSGNAASLPGVALANNVPHSITGVYSGDNNFLPSTSAALALAATTLPDTVTLASNGAAASPGQVLVFTATVTPTITPLTGAEQNPTGSVLFYNGTTLLGTVALTAAPVGDTATAALTTETLPGGVDTVTAVYQGDSYYDAGTSNPVTLNVEDFTITPSPSNPATNLTIVQGASGSAAFVITGLGGFNNAIQVICAVAQQDDMTCTASPQQITPPGTATFVVQTFLPGQQTASAAAGRNLPLWPRAVGGTALAFLAFFLLPVGRRARIFAGDRGRRMLVLLLLLAGLGGVGLGCSSGSAQVNGTGTPLGVATLKITATANVANAVVSHSVYLTVNVVPASQ